MKKYILFFISAFLVSALIIGGVIGGFAKTEKIQANTEEISKQKIIDIEELVRQLIPDKGQEVERWDIYASLTDYIKWDSLSLKYNIWKGVCALSWGGEVSMMLRKKWEPREWAVYLIGDGPEYNGFFIAVSPSMPQRVYPDFEFRDPFTLKQGDYVNDVNNSYNYGSDNDIYEDEDVITSDTDLKYQFKGKIPTWIYVNKDDPASIFCYFNPEKRRAVTKEVIENLSYLENYY
ncbi:hypothetical protein [Odoribacter lunatus]|uniref:hypothetical protein n=1 Tax=Odoribacter lunatus TaxID=2941335 RepID=UPI00203B7399|nr:hypothetical protein [Odoribacter lunatus]